jgi:hypothetical protein
MSFIVLRKGIFLGPLGVRTGNGNLYAKELSPRGLECECAQKERSTSITKQLVFQYPRGNDLSLLAGITEGTDGRRFVLLHVVDFRLELDLPRFHPLKGLHNPV